MWARKYESNSSDLAFRIIEKAKNIQQKQNIYREKTSIFAKIANWFDFSGFYIPAPAYVVPLVFLLGFYCNGMLYPSVTLGDFVDNLYMDMGI